MLFHRVTKTGPVKRKVLLGRERLHQFRRHAIRLQQISRFLARHHDSGIVSHLLKQPIDPFHAAVDRRKESLLFRFDHLGDSRRRLPQFGVGNLGSLGDRIDQLIEERFAKVHLVSVQNRTSHQTPNDRTGILGAGIHVLVNGKNGRTRMVGDSPQSTPVIAVVLILHADHFGRRLNNRKQAVDVEIRGDTLQYARRTLEPHTGVDVLAGKRLKIVGRIADAVELSENEIPDFDVTAILQLVIDLAARPTDAVGPLARRRGGPEVFVLVHACDSPVRQSNLLLPDPVRLVVVLVDRDGQSLRIDTEPFLVRQKLPCPMDRVLFEVIAEAEVSQHFKKRVMECGAADVVDVSRPQGTSGRSSRG